VFRANALPSMFNSRFQRSRSTMTSYYLTYRTICWYTTV